MVTPKIIIIESKFTKCYSVPEGGGEVAHDPLGLGCNLPGIVKLVNVSILENTDQ